MDFTLVGREQDPSDIFGQAISWNDFVNLIPGTGKTIEKATSTTNSSSTTPATSTTPKKEVRFSMPKEESPVTPTRRRNSARKAATQAKPPENTRASPRHAARKNN